MELFVVIIIGLIVSALLFGEFGGKKNNASGFTPRETESTRTNQELPQDWTTDPACYWMLGSIYYQSSDDDTTSSQSSGISPFPASSPDQSDWYTDPAYAHLIGNIYHHDDSHLSSSFSDSDAFYQETATSSCSCNDASWTTDRSAPTFPATSITLMIRSVQAPAASPRKVPGHHQAQVAATTPGRPALTTPGQVAAAFQITIPGHHALTTAGQAAAALLTIIRSDSGVRSKSATNAVFVNLNP